MSNEPSVTLVLGDTEEHCRRALIEGAESASLVPMTWGTLDLGAPEGMAVSAVLCQYSPPMSQHRGLLAILRRAYPDVPFFSFSDQVSPEIREASKNLGLDAHIKA